jgi:hypothetical protein
LDNPEAVIEAKVGVEPPTEPLVELRRSLGVRDGNDDYLQLHIDCRDARVDGVVTANWCRAHGYLLSFMTK